MRYAASLYSLLNCLSMSKSRFVGGRGRIRTSFIFPFPFFPKDIFFNLFPMISAPSGEPRPCGGLSPPSSQSLRRVTLQALFYVIGFLRLSVIIFFLVSLFAPQQPLTAWLIFLVKVNIRGFRLCVWSTVRPEYSAKTFIQPLYILFSPTNVQQSSLIYT